MGDLALAMMAAGLGRRFEGDTIKPLARVGPYNETIMELNMKRALDAGFNKFMIIINRNFQPYFEDIFFKYDNLDIYFVYQDLNNLPEGVDIDLTSRTKPWGTAQAIYCCREIIDTPFAAANADDLYSPSAFRSLAFKLSNMISERHAYSVGFRLEDVLSKKGPVNRAICTMADDGSDIIADIAETMGIIKDPGDGDIYGGRADGKIKLERDAIASMGLWGFEPGIFDLLSQVLDDFLNKLPEGDDNLELPLSIFMQHVMRYNLITLHNITNYGEWKGVTYLEDAEELRSSLSDNIP